MSETNHRARCDSAETNLVSCEIALGVARKDLDAAITRATRAEAECERLRGIAEDARAVLDDMECEGEDEARAYLLAALTRSAQPAAGETGTFACPICGIAVPHGHSERVQRNWSTSQRRGELLEETSESWRCKCSVSGDVPSGRGHYHTLSEACCEGCGFLRPKGVTGHLRFHGTEDNGGRTCGHTEHEGCAECDPEATSGVTTLRAEVERLREEKATCFTIIDELRTERDEMTKRRDAALAEARAARAELDAYGEELKALNRVLASFATLNENTTLSRVAARVVADRDRLAGQVATLTKALGRIGEGAVDRVCMCRECAMRRDAHDTLAALRTDAPAPSEPRRGVWIMDGANASWQCACEPIGSLDINAVGDSRCDSCGTLRPLGDPPWTESIEDVARAMAEEVSTEDVKRFADRLRLAIELTVPPFADWAAWDCRDRIRALIARERAKRGGDVRDRFTTSRGASQCTTCHREVLEGTMCDHGAPKGVGK